jgi:predicted nucleotidyltransferase
MESLSTQERRQARADATIERLKQHLPAILADRPVMLAYVYGSMAEGCPLPTSDVDIALVWLSDCVHTPYERMNAELEIEIAIEAQAGIHNADVRSINDAPLKVQGHVLTVGQLLYSRDEDLRVEFEVYTRKRYFDFQPALEMMSKAFFEHLEADLRKKGLYGGSQKDRESLQQPQ